MQTIRESISNFPRFSEQFSFISGPNRFASFVESSGLLPFYGRAIKDYTEAIRIGPSYVNALLSIACQANMPDSYEKSLFLNLPIYRVMRQITRRKTPPALAGLIP